MQCVTVRISAPISCLAQTLVSLTQTHAVLCLKPLCLPCLYFTGLASPHVSSVSWPVALEAARAWRWFYSGTVIPQIKTVFYLSQLQDCPNSISIWMSGPKGANNQEFSQLLSHTTVTVPSQLITIIYVQGLICIWITPKTLWSWPVAGRTVRANAGFVKHEKAKTGRVERCMAP